MISLLRPLACALLVIFVTSTASWSMHAKAFAHELGHQIGSAQPDGAHHADEHDGDAGGDTAGDHALLHAAGHFAVAAFFETAAWAAVAPGIVRSVFVAPRVERASTEAPFRPPRRAFGA